jgi:hypothetical protein
LPAEELQYRQGERDIERLLRGGLFVPRRSRAQFERFLAHPNARVRALAGEILDEQRRASEDMKRLREQDEAGLEADSERLLEELNTAPDARDEPDTGGADPDDDLPF